MRFVHSMLLPLALLMLGMSAASAHDGITHKDPAAQPAQAVYSGAGEATSLSRSCPGLPGKFCCCAAIHALSGGGKATLADRRSHFLVETTARSTRFASFIPATASTPLPLAARPRAPPPLS